MSNYDYYETLELKRDCSQEEIAEAYRRLSLKNHPKNTSPENTAVNEYQFHKIAEAYEVLSDPNKKGLYDIYGKDGLTNGVLDKNGNLKGGYHYSGNAHEIFEKFMGTSNPFALLRDPDKMSDEKGSAFSSAFGGNNERKSAPLPAITVELECTLEELYNGCVKPLKYTKKALGHDKRTTVDKECEVDVEVFPGYDKSTIVTFKGMGNEAPGEKTSDLLVQIKEKKNECFKRVNVNDLIYIKRLTLAQALNSEPVKITTLDNRKLAVTMDEIISPQTVKIVKGEGMPIYTKEISVKDFRGKKGDLYIKFDIQFPEYIDPMKKEEIIRLLSSE